MDSYFMNLSSVEFVIIFMTFSFACILLWWLFGFICFFTYMYFSQVGRFTLRDVIYEAKSLAWLGLASPFLILSIIICSTYSNISLKTKLMIQRYIDKQDENKGFLYRMKTKINEILDKDISRPNNNRKVRIKKIDEK